MHLAGQGETVRKHRDEGYAMAGLIIGISVMAIVMTAAMPVWKHQAQREKEEELVFRGEQYVHAIGLFQRKYANAYPPNINLLVEQKFLRKKYKDPITGEDFVPLTQASQQGGIQPGTGAGGTAQRGGQATTPATSRGGAPATGRGTQTTLTPVGAGVPGGAPAGGIIGVSSKSTDSSIRLYKGRSHYNEWQFVYTAPVQAPSAVPGQRGNQPGQQGVPGAGGIPGRGRGQTPPNGPFGPGRANFPAGQPTTITLPNGRTMTITPGANGQPNTITTSPGNTGPGASGR
jgi:type II secretory pathway pseudopilin PulG